MRVLILGGDGYLGWPTVMHLSAHNHEVAIADNYLRRQVCVEENVDPLFQVPNLHQRVKLWGDISGFRVNVFIGDLTQWDFISEVFQKVNPEVVIHYAEQPSAPYSMLSRRSALLTIKNNLEVTANTVFATREFFPDCPHCENRHHGGNMGPLISILRKDGSILNIRVAKIDFSFLDRQAACIIPQKSWIRICFGFMPGCGISELRI